MHRSPPTSQPPSRKASVSGQSSTCSKCSAESSWFKCTRCAAPVCIACAGLPKLSKANQDALLKAPSVALFCPFECQAAAPATADSVDTLATQVKAMQVQLDALVSAITPASQDPSSPSYAAKVKTNLPQTLLSSTQPQPQAQKAAAEQMEMERSCVIAGLPFHKNENTTEKVEALIAQLELSAFLRVEKAYRMPLPKNPPAHADLSRPAIPLTKVTLWTSSMASRLCSHGPTLRKSSNPDLHNIFIRPSRPRADREKIHISIKRRDYLKSLVAPDSGISYFINYRSPDFPVCRSVDKIADWDWEDDPDDLAHWVANLKDKNRPNSNPLGQ